MTAIVWFRSDLRLTDNPAFLAALASHESIIPVYIWAPDELAPWQPGGASRCWLHHSLAGLDDSLRQRGSQLILRQGDSQSALKQLIAETGATAVYWNRLYEPASILRDAAIKKKLISDGIDVHSSNASLLFEPWQIETKTGTPYRVYTPYWNQCATQLDQRSIKAAPASLPAIQDNLTSLQLDHLKLLPDINWDADFWPVHTVGEAAAQNRLAEFIEISLEGYPLDRDRPDIQGTSRLSAHLHFGELGPRQIMAALVENQTDAAIKYRKEVVWREFAYHLLYHYPHTVSQPLREKFTAFPWRSAADYATDLSAWQEGKTGIPLVDAGMRELRQTGSMHNRVRMLVGSFLTKNLLIPWQEGARWFWDNLVDADLANNTLGWQWIAGCGADAQPFFRIFNPESQREKFDPHDRYCRRWLPEWGTSDYPEPIVDLKTSRLRALDAYAQIRAE